MLTSGEECSIQRKCVGFPRTLRCSSPFVHPTELSVDIVNIVEEYFSRTSGFDVVWIGQTWFDDRVVYLEPNPAHEFRTMTMELQRAFPSCLPYGGKFAEITPHLTLGDGAAHARLLEGEAAIRERLPIETKAMEAWLMTGGMGPGSWSLFRSFQLGE